MAKIDIIIPVYNTKRYISYCLDSVLKQDYEDYRIIVIDDKSTDGSLDLLRVYKEKFPDKITLIESPINVGAASSRNLGLENATSEYVTFLDSDDRLAPGILKKVDKVSRLYTPDIISSDLHLNINGINADFLGMKNRHFKQNRLIIPEEEKMHIYQERPGVTSKFIRRELIGDNRFPNGLKWEDYAFMIPFFIKAKSIYILEDTGYYYSVNPFGTTTTDMFCLPSHILDIFDGSDFILSKLSDEEKKYYQYELRVVKTMNCLNRVRDLALTRGIKKTDLILLSNLLVNLINLREGDYHELAWYQYQYNNSKFYKFRMSKIEKMLNSSLQQETDENKLKENIKLLTRTYEKRK